MALVRGLLKHLRDLLDRLFRRRRLMVLLIVLLFTVSTDGSVPASFEARIYYMLAGERFDFVGWEIGAVLGKLAYALVAPQRYLDERTRHDFFLDYLRLVGDIQSTDWEIQQVYADPAVENPEAATAELRARLAELRAGQTVRQPIAEAILEEQTAGVLVSNGFGVLGQEFPPVGVHFTPLPMMLIVSPRERIEAIYQLGLRHGLDTAQQGAIEGRIDSAFDVSSLVTGIGGLGAYPAMLLESSSPNWVAEVSPHEWSHHYLLFRPLGWNYETSAEARIINETVASIVGKEIGRQVVARYYPELLPEEPPAAAQPPAEPQPAQPPAFDFRAEMHATRVHVDELLAQGKVREAELYMDERRQVFVEHGYTIRKLNQAYFAFYGAYADEPGAAGADPIGPAVRQLRAQSPDLHTFAVRVAHVTTLAQLWALLED
jgi:hypothetical protein